MKKSGFIEGAVIATIAIFFSKFLGIIYAIPFYKIIGAQGGALYGYAYNIYNFFLVISSAGIPLAISKLTSEYNALKQYQEKEYMFKSIRKIILIFSIVCFLICFLFAPTIGKLIIGNVSDGNTWSDIAYVIRFVSFAILVVPILSISRGYLQGHGYIRPASFSQVVEQIVRVAVLLGGSYLALKVLNLQLKTAIGIAVFGAFVGAIAAYLYLAKRLLQVKKEQNNNYDFSKIDKKQVIKKIIIYSIPFIIINVANSIYNTTDMILLLRGLKHLGYDDLTRETISSVFTTWGSKLNTIVTSIAIGLAISLVPSIAKSNAEQNHEDINNKLNKTIQVFLYVALPLAIFMSIFSESIWMIFYGKSLYGPIIFKYSIITAGIDALYIMLCNGLQGLNKTKLIYVSVITGLLINVCLDIPLMYLFNNLGIYPFYGTITATLIGYIISLTIALITLNKKYNYNYKDTIKKIPKILFSYITMILLSIIFCGIINNVQSRLLLIIYILIIGIILLPLYYLINKNVLNSLFNLNNRFKRKKRD